MELKNQRMSMQAFLEQRGPVLTCWPTGRGITIEDGVAYQKTIPPHKQFALAMKRAEQQRKVLLQPRAGVALIDDHIRLLQALQVEADLLPSTIDAYTRQNRYEEAQRGIERSLQAGRSLLNGLPVVNHGVAESRRIIEAVDKPVEVRHGTPDARLLAEISLAAGFTSYEGGGISYNIPYTKKVPLEKSIRDWQYVDRLVGEYESRGVSINREPFGPLSGTLVPPFISHTVAIIEGLLALEQGVRSITLGYGQCGNLVQDVAAVMALRELGHEYFQAAGYKDYELSTVFHQWMGGFPGDEAKAFGVISWGSTVGALARATKVIVKTPHEAMGIPTCEANLQGLRASRQVVSMLADQEMPRTPQIDAEIAVIRREVKCVMDKVFELGNGDVATGAVKAFAAGVIDVPFAPSIHNAGKLLPVRDNSGAVRIFEKGGIPFDKELIEFHRSQIAQRAKTECREPCFQMVIDDIYAISDGKLVGRPH
jgi:methylaspartate mutase epsilon subunit